jgi:hypothetical protein
LVHCLRAISALLLALPLIVLGAGTAAAHETQQVGDYWLTAGFTEEPTYVGERNGFLLAVKQGADPETAEGVEALELTVEVAYQSFTKSITLQEHLEPIGTYEGSFIPTAAGTYTFTVTGDLEGTPLDVTFQTGPQRIDEVQDARTDQFPAQLPPITEVADQAAAGRRASDTMPIALGLGGAGLLVGLIALALTLAGRRKSTVT